MKVALCFIINYNHILNKETIWREWIEPNKDIINVYFFYKDISKISSSWILSHVIDKSFIKETSYFHVIPAYLSVISYALKHDKTNQWFCLLTESCCPIISPLKFRSIFYANYQYSIINCYPAHWDTQKQRRANLSLLPSNLKLANDPYFILNRMDVNRCIKFATLNQTLFQLICKGGLANESLFAIILYINKQIPNIKSFVTHLTDWSRMTSATSPHLFKEGNTVDLLFIKNGIKKNKYAIFLRKISPEFPDDILNEFIYNSNNLKTIFMKPNTNYLLLFIKFILSILFLYFLMIGIYFLYIII